MYIIFCHSVGYVMLHGLLYKLLSLGPGVFWLLSGVVSSELSSFNDINYQSNYKIGKTSNYLSISII